MAKTALLLVDIQNDFLPPDGSLAVTDGNQILPPVYRLLDEAEKHFDLVVASQVFERLIEYVLILISPRTVCHSYSGYISRR